MMILNYRSRTHGGERATNQQLSQKHTAATIQQIHIHFSKLPNARSQMICYQQCKALSFHQDLVHGQIKESPESPSGHTASDT